MEPKSRWRGKIKPGLLFSVFLMAFVITASLPAEAASVCQSWCSVYAVNYGWPTVCRDWPNYCGGCTPCTNPTPACTLSISPTSVSLNGSGQTSPITASGALGTVSWSSSDPSVATVSPSTGTSTTVTAMSPDGTATITATDSGVAGCSKTAIFTVQAPATPPACQWWCGIYTLAYGIIGGNGWPVVCSGLPSQCGGCPPCTAENVAGDQAGVLSKAVSGANNAATTFNLFNPAIVSTGGKTMQVTLTWYKPVFSSGPDESYYVYRQDGNGQYKMVSGKLIYGQIPGDRFVDNGLSKDVEYTYYVEAYWAPPAFSGLSPKRANSNTVKAKWTETPAPTPTFFLKSAQGYDPETGRYNNYDAYAGKYLILWGTFPASGNEAYVNGAKQEVKYQSANQLNVLLSLDVVTGLTGVQVPVYVRNAGVNSNTLDFYIFPVPGGARVLEGNEDGSKSVACDGACLSITAYKISCSNGFGTYRIHVNSTESNFYVSACPAGGSCSTFTNNNEPATTTDGKDYPTGNWVSDNMVFELRNASDSSLMKSANVGSIGCVLAIDMIKGYNPDTGIFTEYEAVDGTYLFIDGKFARSGNKVLVRREGVATPTEYTPTSEGLIYPPPSEAENKIVMKLPKDLYSNSMSNNFYVSIKNSNVISNEVRVTIKPPMTGSCKDRCGSLTQVLGCRCDSGCQSRGDCCSDYASLCGAAACNLPISSLSLSFATPTSPVQTLSVSGTSLSGATVSWSSDNPSVATVSPSTGVSTTVTPKAAGTARITASVSTSCFNTTSVTVTAAPIIPPTAPTVSLQITDNYGFPKSNNAFKIGDGWRLGLTTSPSVGSGKTVALCSRRVPLGQTLSGDFSCRLMDQQTDTSGVWSLQGQFQNGPGGYTEEGQWEEYANVTVGSVQYTSNRITFSVSPSGTTQPPACTLSISPTAIFFSGPNQISSITVSGAKGTVSWLSSNANVATVSPTPGIPTSATVTTKSSSGDATITASDSGVAGCSKTAQVTINAPQLPTPTLSLQITDTNGVPKPNNAFKIGDSWKLRLTTTTPSVGSGKQVTICARRVPLGQTPSGDFSCSLSTVVTDYFGAWSIQDTFKNAAGYTEEGNWEEYAKIDTVESNHITFSVSPSGAAPPPPACALSITPASLSLSPGDSRRLTASNAKEPVEWRTNIPSVAQLTPVPGTTASVTVTAMTLNGTATITATDAAGCSNTTSVSNFIPPSLSCTPFIQTVRPGQYAALTAVGGVPPYTWSTSPLGNPSSGSGSTFVTSFSTAGDYPVALSAGGGTFYCIVQVQIPPPCPGLTSDLIISDFHLTDASGNTKTTFAPGESIFPSVTIRNNGPNAACGSGGHFYVSVYSNQPSQLTPPAGSDINVWAYEPGVIAVGESKTYSVTTNSVQWTNDPLGGGFQANSWTKPAGSYTARVFADSYGMVGEANEGNNQATSSYAVSP